MTSSAAFSRNLPREGVPGPIVGPSENTAAVAEVAADCLRAGAGVMMLKYSLAPGTY